MLVLKKLGNELDGEFLEVINWLSKDQQMQVSFQTSDSLATELGEWPTVQSMHPPFGRLCSSRQMQHHTAAGGHLAVELQRQEAMLRRAGWRCAPDRSEG